MRSGGEGQHYELHVTGIQILVPLGREKVVLYSEIAGAIIDLIINWVLIPNLASAGAAIGTLAAEAVVAIWQYFALRDTVLKTFRSVHYMSIFVGVALGSFASIWIKKMALSEFPTLVISAIIFFSIYLLTLTLTKEPLTLEIEKQVISKLRKAR